MDSRYYLDCNIHLFVGVLIVLIGVSCSSSQKTTPQVPVEDLPQILRESRSRPDTMRNDPSDDVKLTYESNGTSVTIPIDPQRQDFILELEGLSRKGAMEESEKEKANAKQKKQQQVNRSTHRADSTIMQDSLVQAEMAKQIRKVLKNFRRAQNLFYQKDYRGALEMVNRSLEVQRTADALGLKGTIFFMRDDISSAKYYWNKAVQMDPEIPVPNIPELETFIQEIKATEDQQEAEE